MDAPQMPIIEALTPEHPRWPVLLAHLERVEQTRHAFDDGRIKPGSHFLGVVLGDTVVGNISIQVQEIVIPATPFSGGVETRLRGPDGEPLRETYVQTFAVESEHRRRGYGRALQLAALALTRALGCHQMRSWSTFDRTENYALKLSLGFAAHPAIYHSTATGKDYSGVYFVKMVA
jgi:GNAT superfamily N-acetyltransferase